MSDPKPEPSPLDLPVPLTIDMDGADGGQNETPDTPRVSLKEVAVAAGVSVAAASFAMRNIPKVSPQKRAHILKVAAALGYRPDPQIARLMSHLQKAKGVQNRGTIAMLTCYRNPFIWQESYLQRCVAGARNRSFQLGYQLEEFSLADPAVPPKRVQQILYARGIQGVLVAPFRGGVSSLDFDFSSVAASSMGVVIKDVRMHCVRADNYENMKLILAKLRERGYRRIGFALESELEERSHHAWTGALLTDQLHGLLGDPIPPLIYPEFNPKHLLPWLREHRPDVVISTEPFLLGWLREFGFRVPEEIAFVSTSYAESLFSEQVSGIDERPELIGSATIDLLVAHLHRNEFGIPHFEKEVNLLGVWRGDFTAPFKVSPTVEDGGSTS